MRCRRNSESPVPGENRGRVAVLRRARERKQRHRNARTVFGDGGQFVHAHARVSIRGNLQIIDGAQRAVLSIVRRPARRGTGPAGVGDNRLRLRIVGGNAVDADAALWEREDSNETPARAVMYDAPVRSPRLRNEKTAAHWSDVMHRPIGGCRHDRRECSAASDSCDSPIRGIRRCNDEQRAAGERAGNDAGLHAGCGTPGLRNALVHARERSVAEVHQCRRLPRIA